MSGILKAKKFSVVELNKDSLYIPIWVYNYNDTHIQETFVKYDSIYKAYESTKIPRSAISKYLNTNVPIKGLLYYSNPIVDLNLKFQLVNKTLQELSLNPSMNLYFAGNLPKKVWVYSYKTAKLVNGKPFSLIEQVAKFLDTTHKVVRDKIDLLNTRGLLKSYFLFSKALTEKEIKYLI